MEESVMEITLEKIDLLRKRANVSYKEAKEALEKNDGDVVEALASLEEEDKIKPQKEDTGPSFWEKAKRLYVKASKVRFIISREGTSLLNIGVPLALLVAVVAMPLAAALIILALITGCRIKFIKTDGEECRINDSLDNIADKASKFADKVAKEIKDA
jgi:hypothetical protein